MQSLRVFGAAGRVLDLAVGVLAAVGDKVTADRLAVPRQINGQGHVVGTVAGGRGAQRDVVVEHVGPRFDCRLAPTLANQARHVQLQFTVEKRGRSEGCAEGVNHGRAGRDGLVDPTGYLQIAVERAKPAEVVVGPTVGPGEALGRGKPVGGDVGPEETGQSPGLLPASFAIGLAFDEVDPLKIHAVVARAAILAGAEPPGPQANQVQPPVAFLRYLGPIEGFSQPDQVGGVQEGDVRVTCPDPMPHAAFDAEGH